MKLIKLKIMKKLCLLLFVFILFGCNGKLKNEYKEVRKLDSINHLNYYKVCEDGDIKIKMLERTQICNSLSTWKKDSIEQITFMTKYRNEIIQMKMEKWSDEYPTFKEWKKNGKRKNK